MFKKLLSALCGVALVFCAVPSARATKEYTPSNIAIKNGVLAFFESDDSKEEWYRLQKTRMLAIKLTEDSIESWVKSEKLSALKWKTVADFVGISGYGSDDFTLTILAEYLGYNSPNELHIQRDGTFGNIETNTRAYKLIQAVILELQNIARTYTPASPEARDIIWSHYCYRSLTGDSKLKLETRLFDMIS